jgi:catechol 2,3-dioxygenase-like lactoylglutathione lyase family enzyme
MGLMGYIGEQFHKPTGLGGKLVTFVMNRQNDRQYRGAETALVLRNTDTVLDTLPVTRQGYAKHSIRHLVATGEAAHGHAANRCGGQGVLHRLSETGRAKLMKFISPLIAVSDMERSKTFYKEVLGLDIVTDFGANVVLTGGIALQAIETWREFISGEHVSFKGNSGELYFEERDFDDFAGMLEQLGDVQYVHPPLTHSWGQRVVRFYDPDGHIIEVGENMTAVARRFQAVGMNTAEIAARMDVKAEYVLSLLREDSDS